MKQKAVLVDIDGTLVTLTDFDYEMLNKEESVKVEYLNGWNKNTLNAKGLDGGIEVLKKFKEEGYELVFLTARGVSCKKYTIMKLKEIGVWEMVDSMWHRPVRMEGVSSSVYKGKMIKMLMKKGFEFEWAMDDEEKNLRVMEDFGMKAIDARVWW